MQLRRAPAGRWDPPTLLAPYRSVGDARPRRLRRTVLRPSSNFDAPLTSAAQQEPRYTVEQLQLQMAEAVATENYATAAAIRDQLLSLDISQPEDVLKLQLKAAVANELFLVRCKDIRHI